MGLLVKSISYPDLGKCSPAKAYRSALTFASANKWTKGEDLTKSNLKSDKPLHPILLTPII